MKVAKGAIGAVIALAMLFSVPLATATDAYIDKNSKDLFVLWAKVNRPFSGEADPIGAYGAGCLAGASELPLDGPGYAVMRPSRLRYFGHASLVHYLQRLGEAVKAGGLPLLLVGDMGRPRGGPMPTGHASHQIGLDVDLWYEMSKTTKKRPSRKERETWGADPYVVLSKNELTRAWGDRERKLVGLATAPEVVARVFVHPAIKRDLCTHPSTKDAPWLYKVRAWWNHHDHLHARLHCPESAKHCEPQEALKPSDNGCGAELAWWFTEEAKEEGRKMALKFQGREFPKLPEACGEMVKGLAAKMAHKGGK